jgi:REP-associated tyrosine transposase
MYAPLMPWVLKRYQRARELHFVTFSCCRRQPLLASARAKRLFETALEQARRQYGFFVTGYVIMPEHVHLLLSEPERDTLAGALQAVKQSVARRLITCRPHFWQAPYGPLAIDGAGNIYGVVANGTTGGYGAMFEITA